MEARYVLIWSGSHYRFALEAVNSEIILSSEPYRSKSAALSGIELIRKNCVLDSRYERNSSGNGDQGFRLKAANGLTIATSQAYSSESERETGIALAKFNGPSARVFDQTEAR